MSKQLWQQVLEINPGWEYWAQFVEQYLQHGSDEASGSPEIIAAKLAAHLQFGHQRETKLDLISIITPDDMQTPMTVTPGSTLLQIITSDGRFLVDTVGMEIRRQGWEVRLLEHPQLAIERDEKGCIYGISQGVDALTESWLSLEIYPPLGANAAQIAPQLEAGLRKSLADVRLVNDDFRAMRLRCLDIALAMENRADAAADEVAELLNWLARDNFIFLGYQRYDYAGKEMQPCADTALGIMRNTTVETRSADMGPQLLVMTKSPQRSLVYQESYLDDIGVRISNAAGQLVGEYRFLGLLSNQAYVEAVWHVPTLAAKANKLLRRSGFEMGSYGWNALWHAISTYPRDELFDATIAELEPTLHRIAQLRDRRIVRIFPRIDHYGCFVTALVYLPRERYNTATRERISQLLLTAFTGESLEFEATTNSAVLTRLFFTIKLAAPVRKMPDIPNLEAQIAAFTTTWVEQVEMLLVAEPAQERGIDYPEAYEAVYSPAEAVADLEVANTVAGDADLRYRLHRGEQGQWRLKIFSYKERELHDIWPHLANLGAQVCDEQPFELQLRGRSMWLLDFGLELPSNLDGELFVAAFDASYRGYCASDGFNKLVTYAALPWEHVVWLRAIANYLKQGRIGLSLSYISTLLREHRQIVVALVDCFCRKFDPARISAGIADASWEAELARVLERIDQVESLEADRILRAYADFIAACLRTNVFSGAKTLAFKVNPRALAFLPDPKPWAEIFVYSTRVQGVHLRFGKVARGGLRWSDRAEDFRTEVLGLVKAQAVKNTVIVPVGAKGGFVPQQLPDPADRPAWLAEGQSCYRDFITALLSITDNIVDGVVVPTGIRYDDDDPYLVVAADKGTATFSDIANEIAQKSGFWLGDAFASGGSAGYDHKAMGITARGAWKAIEQHFAEMDINPQQQDFSCVGIGDMSGDVFGNAMLESRHIRLLAAFDHRHIFLDPDPDAARSFNERERLFALPRSSWKDYNPELISPGGGVFARDQKWIPISAQVRQRLSIPDGVTEVTPAQMISAILRAEVDLLYNGGIGTYFKANHESNSEVGDKVNDAVRVDGSQVRARCAVEGGNLGWTQAGRAEYALAGGRINTDFIDNSAGVDTSDHEVNIKILLAGMASEERNLLLEQTTAEVAESVLRNNQAQNLALSNAEAGAADMLGAHAFWIRELEIARLLDRELEGLPSDPEISRRMSLGQGLTRPELSVLLAYTKIAVRGQVFASDLPEDPYLADRLVSYFPKPLQDAFAPRMSSHRLAREIIATVAVNRFVDSQGILAAQQLRSATGAGIADVIRAQLAARAIYQVGSAEVALGRSDLAAYLATDLRLELRRMVERSARWLLTEAKWPLDVAEVVAAYREPVGVIRDQLPVLLTQLHAQRAREKCEKWVELGASADLAESMSIAAYSHVALSIAHIAVQVQATGLDLNPLDVAAQYYALSESLGIDAIEDTIYQLPRKARWDSLARAALRDDLLVVHAQLTQQACLAGGAELWLAKQAADRLDLVRQASAQASLAGASVALGALRTLIATS